jgi:segregation and condensation protein A
VRLDGPRFIRAAASWLQARPQLGHDVFAQPPPGRDPQVASYMALMEACLTVLRGPDAEPAAAPVYRPPIPDIFRVPSILVRMHGLVAAMTAAQPLEAFLPRVPAAKRDVSLLARSAVAATFMAPLELCRGAHVMLEQVEPFGPIVVQAIRDAVPGECAAP